MKRKYRKRESLLLQLAFHQRVPGAQVFDGDMAGAGEVSDAESKRVLALFPRLAERINNGGDQLSGGEQQMLAIGRALMTNPRLLVLDEATEGLAPLVREDIWRCLHALRAEGQSILVIDKYVQKLVQLANQHTIIERGRVVWLGESSALEADRDLWQRYIGV